MPVTVAKTGLTDEVSIPLNVNLGLVCPTPDHLTALLGKPRDVYSQVCQQVSNSSLAALIQTANVGPFSVTGLRLAVESLRTIMREIRTSQPNVYSKLGTAGMLCCRRQRGSHKISSHSWGTAIDLKLDGKLDVRGNKKVHYGLTLIAPIFNRHGWFWGAAFRTEDAMHFEVGKGKLEQWKNSGLFGTTTTKALRRGDKGDAVRLLQSKLVLHGTKIKLDGDFGDNTDKAVRQFQLKKSLSVDGIVGARTRKALGLS